MTSKLRTPPLRRRHISAYELCVRVTYCKTYRRTTFPTYEFNLVERTASQRVHSVRLAYAYRAISVRIPYLCVFITNISVLLTNERSVVRALCV